MKTVVMKVVEFLKSMMIPRACEECERHERQFDQDCEKCIETRKKRVSEGMQYLTYN